MRLSKILVWSLVIGTSGTLGLAVSFLIVFYGLRGVGVALTRITVPGGASVRLAPGEYWAFHEPRTVVNGVVYDRPDSVDGLRVTIADTEGNEVPAMPPRPSTVYTIENTAVPGKPLFRFLIVKAGEYTLTSDFAGGREGRSSVIAIHTDFERRLWTVVAIAVAVPLLFVGGAALALVLWPRRADAAAEGIVTARMGG